MEIKKLLEDVKEFELMVEKLVNDEPKQQSESK